MRSNTPLCRALLAALALVLSVLAVLGTTPSAQAASPTASSARTVTVSGCSAFSGAKALGYYYADAYVKIYPCGARPSFDGARTGGGPKVLPYAGSTTYYLGYQCIELVARFLKLRFNADPGKAHGAQAVDRYAAAYPTKFVKIANGTFAKAPVKGDVLSLSAKSTFSDVGHTGVVISSKVSSSGNGTVRTVEENWGGAGGTSGYHNYTVKNWRVLYPGLPYIKWLRSK